MERTNQVPHAENTHKPSTNFQSAARVQKKACHDYLSCRGKPSAVEISGTARKSRWQRRRVLQDVWTMMQGAR